MYTDPIADYLTRIRNAIQAGHKIVDIPSSRLKIAMTEVLKEKGFIRGYRVNESASVQPRLQIALKYDPSTKRNAIVAIQRISKPGLRKYARRDALPRVLNGLGIAILSTSKGVMSNKDAARAEIGGEVLCYVY